MKRAIAWLLALCSLCLCFVFTACGETTSSTETQSATKTDTVTETETATVTETETQAETETDEYIDNYYRNIPEGSKVAEGYTFKYFSYDYTTQMDWNIYLAPKSEGNGSKIQSAAYFRNIEVEQKYGCSVELNYEEVWTSYTLPLKAQIKSGDAPWDVCCFYGSPDLNIAMLVQNNMLFDWNKLPYVNLTELWYNQSANTAYSLLGKQFLGVSEITRTVHQHSRVLMNQTLFNDYGHAVKEIYQTVNSGNWTYAALSGFIKDAYRNTNATETGKDKGDTFGMVITSSFAANFVDAAGELPISIDKDGVVTYNFSSKRISNIVKKLVDYCYNNPDVWFEKASIENNYNSNGVIYGIFESGRALFSFYSSDPMYLLAISEFDYSYLPYPKYDNTQAEYVTVGSGGLMGVPRTVASRNLEATGLLIEALSAASRKYVYSKFIEEYMETRVLRDPESLAIYKKMANNTTYSTGLYLDPAGAVNGYFTYFTESNSVNVTSKWKADSNSITTAYNKLINSVKLGSTN